MFKQFIDRPVLSTVISIIIVILGVIGINILPVAQYPDIAPPTVMVTANYPGANAQTVLESIIIPVEEQINGVEHMQYITSTASNDGSARIQVFFEQGVDPDIAAVHVQNRVSRALPQLPAEVTRSGVTTQKQSTDALMWMSFYSTNKDYDATFIQNYLNINIIPELKRITGVGDINSAGVKNYAMRIWLDPDKLASYKLEPTDVLAAINEQSQEAAAGTLGQNDGKAFEYVIRYSGRYNSVEQYENIVIKAVGNGQFLRLGDVAKIELDAQGYNVVSTANGYPAVSVGVFQTPGSNAQEIIKNVHAKINELRESFPPGIDRLVNFDTNLFLEASIHKVLKTLFEAFLLVFLVVFIFLQDLRSTLIPAIAVPVSIIGTFFFISLFGFSINLLTLFALVLAIGIVVDDAIVVVEAVHAKLESGAASGRIASHSAMGEITGAIISITLVMGSVFIPITFISGPSGVFYKQFGITLIVAIAISALNALTLSPALCALLLKPHTNDPSEKKGLLKRFYTAFNVSFNYTTQKYLGGLKFLYRHKWVTAAILLGSTAIMLWAAQTTSKGFVPKEDRAVIMTNIELPAGASLDRTTAIIDKLSAEAKQIPGIVGMSFSAGSSLLGGAGSNFGLGFIILDKWENRKADTLASSAIIRKLFQTAGKIPGAQMLFFEPPSIRGYGVAEGFQLELLDKFGGDFKDFDNQAKEYLKELSQRPEILYAQTSFNTQYPQYELDIDIPRAKEAGVTINSIFNTLQGYIGGIYAADFARFGKQYRVYIQALPNTRAEISDLSSMYVRNNRGEMAPITEFVRLERIYGPQSVTRFNLFNAVHVTGATNPGYSSGDAIKAVQEVSKNLPANLDISFSGLTREEITAGNQTILILLLVILFVYFILAGQYESYMLPLAVMFSLPVGMMGAFISTKMMGLEINIYFQIALIMLIGLLAKNAILIVELSVQKRRAGESIYTAAIDGAKVRFRPILMTSFAFIFGLLPLVFSTGVGAVGDRSIGTAAVGGLFVGTVLGVFVVPPLFMLFQWLQEKVTTKPIPTTLENPEQKD